jgi:hypothetical protein
MMNSEEVRVLDCRMACCERDRLRTGGFEGQRMLGRVGRAVAETFALGLCADTEHPRASLDRHMMADEQAGHPCAEVAAVLEPEVRDSLHFFEPQTAFFFRDRPHVTCAGCLSALKLEAAAVAAVIADRTALDEVADAVDA